MTKTEREIELEKKLEITVKALKKIEHKCFDKYLMNNGWIAVSELRDVAHYALKEIKECHI